MSENLLCHRRAFQKIVAWLFFTLKHRLDENDFWDEEIMILKNSFVFPTPESESVRINAIHKAVTLHFGQLDDEYDVDIIDPKKNTHGYTVNSLEVVTYILLNHIL